MQIIYVGLAILFDDLIKVSLHVAHLHTEQLKKSKRTLHSSFLKTGGERPHSYEIFMR